MDKENFLLQLEKLLYNIPAEEREEALEYYRSYFEDAGEENEAMVLEELGSAQEIALSIKEGLSEGASREEYLKYPPQLRNKKEQSKAGPEADTYEYGKNAGNYRRYYEKGTSSSQSGTSSGQEYKQYGNYEKYEGKDKTTKWILLIIAAVVTLPIWGSIASFLLGIAGTCVAILIGLGLFSIGGLVGGIICIVIGITRLCVAAFAQGLVALGVGLLLIAGSGISVVVLVLLCGKFVPWAVRQITDLFHKLVDWCRRSLA